MCILSTVVYPHTQDDKVNISSTPTSLTRSLLLGSVTLGKFLTLSCVSCAQLVDGRLLLILGPGAAGRQAAWLAPSPAADRAPQVLLS